MHNRPHALHPENAARDHPRQNEISSITMGALEIVTMFAMALQFVFVVGIIVALVGFLIGVSNSMRQDRSESPFVDHRPELFPKH